MAQVSIYRDFTGDYLRTHYTCIKCQKTAISENEEEMFFCPFCGEKFEKVKCGKWVRHKPNGILWTLKCSECGWIDNRITLSDKFNYCPSCGIKME